MSVLLTFSLFCFLSPLTESTVLEWNIDFSTVANTATNSECTETKFLQSPGQYGGYYFIEGSTDGHMFYLYFENRFQDPNAPLVFWTNGGPGCSSFFGLFLENGPYEIQDDMTLCWNPYGWDIGHNIIFVEQPLNVGFSYSTSKNDTVTREEQVAEHMLQFFYSFFEAHPDLQHKDFYMTGESFAGHYLPVIAARILEANAKDPQIKINLKGIALGDPWTHPSLQFKAYPVYEHEMGLVSETLRYELMDRWKFCDYDLRYCNSSSSDFSESLCAAAYEFCDDNMFLPIFEKHPTINYYDIRKGCYVDGCYNVSKLLTFMNLKEVRQRFNVPEDLEWKDCSDPVYFDMYWDLGTNMAPFVGQLLNAEVKVLVFVGEQDLICNYIGNRAWVDKLVWNKSEEWNHAINFEWIVDNTAVGECASVDTLTFIKIKDCGHMVPMDQPLAALEMISIFTRDSKKWNLGKPISKKLRRSFYEFVRAIAKPTRTI